MGLRRDHYFITIVRRRRKSPRNENILATDNVFGLATTLSTPEFLSNHRNPLCLRNGVKRLTEWDYYSLKSRLRLIDVLRHPMRHAFWTSRQRLMRRTARKTKMTTMVSSKNLPATQPPTESVIDDFIESDEACVQSAAASVIYRSQLNSQETKSPWDDVIRRYAGPSECQHSDDEEMAYLPATIRPIVDLPASSLPTTNDAPLWKVDTRV
jgi:hypothetical protein